MKKQQTFFSFAFLMYLLLSLGAADTWAQTRPDPTLYLAPPTKTQASGSLGVSYNSTQQSYRFSLRSINATRVELLVFTAAKNQESKLRTTLQKMDNQTWSIKVPKAELSKRGVGQVFYYGYRLWGPNWPYSGDWKPGSLAGFISDVDDSGNRFNPNKLVFDPYAREISHDPINLGHRTTMEFATGNYRNIDTSLISPKGIYTDGLNRIQKSSARIQRPLKDEIIYEAHIRGLTKNNPNIPKEIQGTYKGAIELIPYLKSLGITAIEFLPLQETQNDQNDLELNPADYNYWGYMTLNYFAPDRRYSSDKTPGGPTREFQMMTQAFKNAGIKVYVDVVYNHTAEGGLWSKDGDKDPNTFELYSFRGIDSSTYYQRASNLKYYQDNTGIGHNLNAGHPMVSALIVDSLKYWRDLGVDGFRFDLASVLGNTNYVGQVNFNKYAPESALNKIYREIPSREIDANNGVDLIAEPWAIDMYQVGDFPEKWAEWNGKFRDTMRKKLNQLGYETVTPDDIVKNIGGSRHIFEVSHRGPYHSINFMVAHDGFTLRDLFSFNSKLNTSLKWPMGPSGGGEDTNHSWDQGGQIEDQVKAVKNALSLLMLSAGTPMITAGDENFRTQFGNNNAYNLDTSATWLNWAEFERSPHSKSVFSYTQKLIALRKKVGALRRNDFFKGEDFNGNGIKDIVWLTDQGEMTGDQFGDGNRHVIGYRLDLSEEDHPEWKSLVVYFNFDSIDKQIHLPFWIGASGSPSTFDPAKWSQIASSAKSPSVQIDANGNFLMESRSTIVFVEK